ncbi:MAG: ABC transporter permease [Acidibacillus sp.]|uniref:Glutathione transport system permease protein GsiD n=1 Tax=Sulfoacidibacillus ferrooxidans TaxID=2005001 RepID=A0A9X2ADX3_9BACL|nr:ABC transporter permease [Sulfoacidibacillus ferrooxidans]MCI0182742.1 Glutathione transport system permease protein GsiD [Sulfoacidibacillus ferrooxidans]MCY0892531.1 ABC transporter permease [Acidibacillus sp.]
MSQAITPPSTKLTQTLAHPQRKAQSKFVRVLKAYPLVFVGGLMVLILIFVALFAGKLAPFNPDFQFANGLAADGAPLAPNHTFIMGTDDLGRDVYSRLLFGARISLEVGVFASLISLFIGTSLGIISGYYGKWIDSVIMRITDIMLAFPFILFVVALVAVLTPSVSNIFIAIGVLGWASTARIVRAQVLAVKEFEYVQAARALGSRQFRILFRIILPNIMAPVIVLTTLAIGNNMLLESTLSFLGIGVQPPTPSWGSMLAEGQQVFEYAPWLLYYPGLALLFSVLGFNLLGDGLRELFNPRRVR